MKNPESIIRGIMREAAASESEKIAKLVGRHIKSKKPTAAEANKHFTHDENAAEEIVKLAKSMEEQTQLEEAKSAAWQRKEGKDPEGGLNKKGVFMQLLIDGQYFVDRLSVDGTVTRMGVTPNGSAFGAAWADPTGFLQLEPDVPSTRWQIVHYDLTSSIIFK